MQKLTIFFIGATVIVVLVTGSVLGYKFFTRDDAEKEITAIEPVVEIAKEIPEKIPEVIEDTRIELDKPKETDTAVLEQLDPFALASIRTWDVSGAGFGDVQLNYAPFNGVVFDSIDISVYNDNDHISYEIFEASEPQGTIDELIFPTEEITNEIYGILLQEISKDEKFTINETNQYGDKSFFANNSEDKNSVFLVVKMGLRMYTLHYPAKNHNKIKNLINIIHG